MTCPLQQAVEHYAKLAKEPGWRAYVWDQINRMAKESEMFEDLPRLVTERVNADRAKAEDLQGVPRRIPALQANADSVRPKVRVEERKGRA